MAAEGKGKGRKKITMAKIENESHIQVTFSKRRSGLFKKANELCILTGAEIGIIVFSPSEKVFSFGHPSVEEVTNKFLIGNTDQSTRPQDLIRAQRDEKVREMITRITNWQNLWDVEKKHREDLEVMMVMSQSQRWWEVPIDELGLEQLEQVLVAMKALQSDINKESERRRLFGQSFYGEGSNSAITPLPEGANYYGHKLAMPSLMGPTYLGGGSNILPSFAGANFIGSGEGGSSGGGNSSSAIMPFFDRANYYGYGAMPSLVGSADIGSGSISTFSFPAGPSYFGGGEGSSSGGGGGNNTAIMPFSSGDNSYGHRAMQSLVGPTDVGGGRSNTFPFSEGPIYFGGGEGSSSSGAGGNSTTIMPFLDGANYYGHGTVSSLVRPTDIGSGSIITFPFLAGPSDFGGSEGSSSVGFSRFPLKSNAFRVGGNSDGNIGSGSITAQPTFFEGGVGSGFPFIDEPSSSREGARGSQSYPRVSESGGSMTPHGHGRGFY